MTESRDSQGEQDDGAGMRSWAGAAIPDRAMAHREWQLWPAQQDARDKELERTLGQGTW